MKIYINELGHMTNMATMPIYSKNFKISSSPEPIDRWPWNMVCSIRYSSSTKIVQIMTLGCPHLFHTKVKFCHIGVCMGKSENYFFWKLLQSLVSELLEAFN